MSLKERLEHLEQHTFGRVNPRGIEDTTTQPDTAEPAQNPLDINAENFSSKIEELKHLAADVIDAARGVESLATAIADLGDRVAAMGERVAAVEAALQERVGSTLRASENLHAAAGEPDTAAKLDE